MSLNVAIVGVGNIGNRHAQVYEKRQDARIVAVCDILREKADRAAERYKCRAFYSVKELASSGLRIDAVSVCTAGKENGGDHHQPTMELLEAGLPVLGEKPISNEIARAREMVALARQKNLRYGINLNHRFTPAALRAKEWVQQGRLGELNIINMTMWINNPNETSPWFHIRALHPHSLDVMRYFAGDVAKAQAFFKRGPKRDSPHERRVCWSNVQANLLFENGVIGHLTGSYDAGGSYGLETLEVVGSEARFVLRDACERLEFYPRFSRQVETYAYLGNMMGFNETFDSRIGKWVEQNLQQVKPEEIDASGEDALKVQTIIEAVIESWEKGTVVTL
ncbi:MAG: oxidoreductase [Candidatus Handelsmanbacteria bacterium RIFCSPLOWO2_12_FULL_64_10]|uniref:Oxidoreductase n=1 Tax=Handelsmanbacteria sp. (strain RIFCSPLOWO2_12_FULL_64_10) TaxID=1817868 RepID=A0A1F6CRT2_HANXR|nr:MAG: oxidoreductase [Candidatus Handelsmanbacteria bacterium RIFCSPLOWO2_12_FULL_64_10]